MIYNVRNVAYLQFSPAAVHNGHTLQNKSLTNTDLGMGAFNFGTDVTFSLIRVPSDQRGTP